MKIDKRGMGLALVLALSIGLIAFFARANPTEGGGKDAPASSGPRYTVIDTEGHNLIVTDNRSNTLYFYTVDKGEEVGSELKLRGTIDLNQVGKATIQPKRAK